jgi:hypothetical protein
MVDVQKGSTALPIIVVPRIGGIPVTQTEIKNNFSNKYVNEGTTPIAWTLEYQKRGESTPSTQAWDESKSTDEKIFFDMPDTFWEDWATYTILVYWTISTEKVYTELPTQITVKDLHVGI